MHCFVASIAEQSLHYAVVWVAKKRVLHAQAVLVWVHGRCNAEASDSLHCNSSQSRVNHIQSGDGARNNPKPSSMLTTKTSDSTQGDCQGSALQNVSLSMLITLPRISACSWPSLHARPRACRADALSP